MAKRGNPAKPERESAKEEKTASEEKDKKMPWMKKGSKKACK